LVAEEKKLTQNKVNQETQSKQKNSYRPKSKTICQGPKKQEDKTIPDKSEYQEMLSRGSELLKYL
jgi:hypothetical protein